MSIVFHVVGTRSMRGSVNPFSLILRAENGAGDLVEAIALRCRIAIDSKEPRDLVWTRLDLNVPAFTRAVEFEVPLPEADDAEPAASRILRDAQIGDIPLRLRFTGTVFRRAGAGLAAAPLYPVCDVRCTIPVKVWRSAVALHHPALAWPRPLGRPRTAPA